MLLVTTPLPEGGGYSNARSYHARGWCYFELHMSSLVKNADVLWDLSHYQQAATYAGCQTQMRAGRLPPLSPPRLEAAMRERVAAGSLSFSYASDLEPVLDMYRRGFVQAFEGYRKLRGIAPGAGTTIFYGNLGWEAAEALELAKVIAFIGGHCEMTEGALELVTGMLRVEAESRLSLDDVCAHSWVGGQDAVPWRPHGGGTAVGFGLLLSLFSLSRIGLCMLPC